jgi:hypothetical protein
MSRYYLKTRREFMQRSKSEGYVRDKFKDIIDVDEIKELTIEAMSPAMKQAALAFMPQILLSMINLAIGETEYECEECGHKNLVISGDGDFRAQKYMLEQGVEWIPIIKTMNVNVGIELPIPEHVLQAPDEYTIYEEIMERWLTMAPELNKQTIARIYDRVRPRIYGTEPEPAAIPEDIEYALERTPTEQLTDRLNPLDVIKEEI